jgi:hypothetical protein
MANTWKSKRNQTLDRAGQSYHPTPQVPALPGMTPLGIRHKETGDIARGALEKIAELLDGVSDDPDNYVNKARRVAISAMRDMRQ